MRNSLVNPTKSAAQYSHRCWCGRPSCLHACGKAVLTYVVRIANEDFPLAPDRRWAAYKLDQSPFLDQHRLQPGPSILIDPRLMWSNRVPPTVLHSLEA